MPQTAHDKDREYRFFWNKSHLNIFTPDYDFVGTLRYNGQTPYALVEYLESMKEPSGKSLLSDVIGNSYTIYELFEQKYFPLKNIQPFVSAQLAGSLLQKMKIEQLVIVDMDGDDALFIYEFTQSAGLKRHELSFSNIKNVVNASNIYASIDVNNVLTDELFVSIGKVLDLNEAADTGWLFTGEIVNYCNSGFPDFMEQFFSQIQIDLPLRNSIWIDKYSLLNYQSILPENFFVSDFSRLIVKMPLTIFNQGLLPDKNLVKVVCKGNPAKVFRPQPEAKNIFQVNSHGHLFNYINLTFDEGILWFWNKASKSVRSKILFKQMLLSDLIGEYPIKDIKILQDVLSKQKRARWQIEVNKKLWEENNEGRLFQGSKRQLFSTHWDESFVYMPHVKKEDLLVLNGQKVFAGEPLNKPKNLQLVMQTKKFTAPVNGRIATRYFDKGFLSLRANKEVRLNLNWLAESDSKVIRRLDHNVLEIEVESFSTGLNYVQGPGFFGTLLVVHDYNSLMEDLQQTAGLLVVFTGKINYQQLLELYNRGVRAVVAPNVDGLEKIAQEFWQVFTIGIFSEDIEMLPETAVKQLLGRQGDFCYLDNFTNELKLRSENREKYTFSVKQQISKNFQDHLTPVKQLIRKGSIIELLIPGLLYRQARVQQIDGSELRVKFLDEDKIFHTSLDHVNLDL